MFKKLCFLVFFALAFVIACMAQFTVDFDTTTTTMNAIREMHLNTLLDSILLGAITVMQLLKYFFPRIDGKK